jgi:hypothetical protein
MPKASIELPNGTKIEIDGTIEEIQRITDQYRSPAPAAAAPGLRQAAAPAAALDDADTEPDIARIVALIREIDEAEIIERQVLNSRDVLNRVLLPLYIVHNHVNQAMGLTSGDIEKVTDQLSVKVNISSASTMLSGRAKAFVTGDAVRKKGGTVRYRINRRGIQHFNGVLGLQSE